MCKLLMQIDLLKFFSYKYNSLNVLDEIYSKSLQNSNLNNNRVCEQFNKPKTITKLQILTFKMGIKYCISVLKMYQK